MMIIMISPTIAYCQYWLVIVYSHISIFYAVYILYVNGVSLAYTSSNILHSIGES